MYPIEVRYNTHTANVRSGTHIDAIFTIQPNCNWETYVVMPKFNNSKPVWVENLKT